MTSTYQIPVHTRLFRWFFRPIFRGVFHILCQIHIEGQEHIPANPPYLVAINHVSLYEPPFILAFWPRPLEAVGAVDIWHRRGQSILVRLYGGIQVHRGQFDRQLIDSMFSAVKAGHPLLIAPEGGRTHSLSMRQGLPGAAYLVDKTHLPVVPVGITGTTDDLFDRIFASWKRRGPRPRLGMHIGKPLNLPPIVGRGEERRQALQRNIDLVMIHIGKLLPQCYHGVYAERIAEIQSNLSKGT